ncbi:protein fluG [Diospyros lotus]|uniref:protein fluG n=1 Tax=Diospyros lotus TaxID=55363 RepID=UPI00224EB8F3|nr:protein fluG [Diospyros lotus]
MAGSRIERPSIYIAEGQGGPGEDREMDMEEFRELKEAVENVELVDGHAHNLVAVDSNFPFLRCFSEATGDALSDAPHTLSFKRSVRDIAELYGTKPSLQEIEGYRKCYGLQHISSICFKSARIAAVLIDDGIKFDKMHEIAWHKNVAPVVGRVLRIEHLAEKILDEERPGGSTWTLDAFIRTFIKKLKSVADQIIGLKSIAAYRSGLEINTNVTSEEAQRSLVEVLCAGCPVRITNKNFIDYLFMQSLEVASQLGLPMQIHTGFGDKDLDLRLSNPLHLHSILEDKRFSNCRIVLLHASYPFSREASYLASVYPQVYLDFGLAIPKLSVHGMISSIKELLELAPINKVMFSTDGYAFPETFYLGAKRAREVVFSVLRDACITGDLSIPEAIEAVKDIFSENAKKFYKINLDAKPIDSKPDVCSDSTKLEIDTLQSDFSLVRVIWVDASGQHRCRVVPRRRFNDVVRKNGVGLTVACMAMSSAVDGPAEGTNLGAAGEIRLMPDLSTKWKIPWTEQEEMVLSDMHLKPGEAWEYCPREALRRVSQVLKDEFNLVMYAGFESEFYLLKIVSREGKEELVPFDSTPYCSTSAFDAASPIFHEVFAALCSLNIPVEQLHAEAGKGQFEMATGYVACNRAADNLIFTREVIRAVARKHGLLATFVPKYKLDDIGSGSHVHISLWENGKNVFMASGEHSEHGMSKVGEEFMAGVLEHLPSILAFTAPVPNSYDRIKPNTWSGAYQCWGKENREAPLRTACPPGVPGGVVSNFEIKAFDGCANPYLGLASIIAAGIDGLRRHLSLPKPIDENPSNLGSELLRLPKSLSESVEALEKDSVFKDLMGKKLLVAIRGIRKAEIAHYSENKDAYKELVHRY